MNVSTKTLRVAAAALALVAAGITLVAWNGVAGGTACKGDKAACTSAQTGAQAGSCAAKATQAQATGAGCCANKAQATQAGGACCANKAQATNAGACAGEGASAAGAMFPEGTSVATVEVPGGIDMIFSGPNLDVVYAQLSAKAEACGHDEGDCASRTCAVTRTGNAVVLAVRGENPAGCCAAGMGASLTSAGAQGGCTKAAGAGCSEKAGAVCPHSGAKVSTRS